MLVFDFVEWDDVEDPEGNTRHIEASGLTPEDVEHILDDPEAEPDASRSTGLPAVFGWLPDGRRIFVLYRIDTEAGVTVNRPVTAYEVDPP